MIKFMKVTYSATLLNGAFGILIKGNTHVKIQYWGCHGWYLSFLLSNLSGKENHKPKIA